MKLHRVELEGFGPFRERQVVDLDAFEADGIFLISGRTGAGKSSVLDGICFALYGGVPRYDGAEKRLRSDHCTPDDPTRVTVEFTTAGRRWRVSRSPDHLRPKRRGEGLTTVAADAELSEWTGNGWVGRASGPRQVALELDEILGLSQQQFLQVILLAQNRFAEFLLARSDDRQKLLRRLFGTRTYEDYLRAFDERRRAAEQAVAQASGAAALLLAEAERLLPPEQAGTDDAEVAAFSATAAVTERLDRVERGAQRADYRAEAARTARDAAEAAHRAAEDAHAAVRRLRQAQEDRERSRAALAALEADIMAVAALREELGAAHQAESLRAPIEAAEEADAARAAGRSVVEALVAAAGGHDDIAALAVSELDDLAMRISGELAVWAEAAIIERDLAARERAFADDLAQIRADEELLATLDAERALLPERRKTLEAELAPVRDRAAGFEAAEARRREVIARRDAAVEAARLERESVAAEEASLAATLAASAANDAVVSLLRRRAMERAGALAADLVDGEPCPVCGATSHPHPAPPSTDPVTDDEIDRAEALQQTAAEVARHRADEARAARAGHAAAAARAGGVAVDAAERAVGDAEAEVAGVADAVATRDRLLARLDDLAVLEAEAVAERERLAAHLASRRERVAALEAELREKRRIVAAARSDFSSVAERVAAAEVRRAFAVDLAEARRAAATAEAAAERAQADRDRRVAASGFPDLATARGALRSARVRGEIDERVRAHDAALRAERDRLRDLELALAGEPEELVDVAAAQTALVAARDAWVAAVDDAVQAAQTADRLRSLLTRAHDALGDAAALTDEHAVIARLADTVAGRAPNTHRMTLESFVLAAELEEIVEAANLRLHDMSAGRYRLRHTDALAARGAASGLGLEILDAHTGAPRPAHSLSGGETFLASLALALGLAEVVTARAGGVRLDTLFIDEGFGSLDDDTLELAMATLDELRQGGRTVGLISHVATMKERIPAQLRVDATPQGPSVIGQDALLVG